MRNAALAGEDGKGNAMSFARGRFAEMLEQSLRR